MYTLRCAGGDHENLWEKLGRKKNTKENRNEENKKQYLHDVRSLRIVLSVCVRECMDVCEC